MQSENRLFDDFVKVLNGAAGTFAGMTREAEGAFRERVREWVGGLDKKKQAFAAFWTEYQAELQSTASK